MFRTSLHVTRIGLRELCDARSLVVHAGAIGLMVVAAWLQPDRAPQRAWSTASGLLAAVWWLPGLQVALGLRRAWPALGPADEAARWVETTAESRSAHRIGACGAALLALLVLQVAAGLGVGIAIGAVAPAPAFRHATPLDARPEILAKTGQSLAWTAPDLPDGGTLRLEPRYWFALAPARASIDLDVLGIDGTETVLASGTLHDFGAHLEMTLPPCRPRVLSVRRAGGAGPPISFPPGSAVLITERSSPITAGLALSLRHLGWAVVLVLGALASAPFLRAGVQGIVLVGVAPLVSLLPGMPAADSARLLARGLLPPLGVPGPWVAAAMLAMLVVSSLPWRVAARPEEE